MIRTKLSLRRPLAIAGAAFVGLTAAVAISAPASAHHPEVVGKAICDIETGNWAVEWTVSNSERDLAGEITKVELTPAGTTVSNIAQGAELPAGGSITGKQTVPGNSEAQGATLKVAAKWMRKGKLHTGTRTGSVKFQGTCKEPSSKPEATFVSNCDGTVVVTLVNSKEATRAASFIVTGDGDFKESKSVAAGESGTVTVPAANAGKITVTEKGKKVAEGKWTEPEKCEKPSEPKGEVVFTCDQLIFTIENPADGKAVTVTFTPNKGEAKTITVGPGETKSVEFDAVEGLAVTPSGDGMDESEPIAWEKPEDCPADGGGGGLPVTGAAAGGIAAGAVVLLGAGVALFLVARRRRLRFTA